MLRRSRSSSDPELRDRAKALMQRAVEPGADLIELDREAVALRSELDRLRGGGDLDVAVVEEIDRYLDFVAAMAHPPAEEGVDALEAEARRIDADVLTAARAVAAGNDVARAEVDALRAQIKDLVDRAHAVGRRDQIQQLLHDAHLDLGYVASGGVAPTSLRLAHERPRP
jgi:hypothetical protein